MSRSLLASTKGGPTERADDLTQISSSNHTLRNFNDKAIHF